MRDRLLWLTALGVALSGLAAIGAGAAAPEWFGALPEPNKLRYLGAVLAAGLVYAGAVALVRRAPVRHGLVVILLVAAALRAITVVTPPLLSTDLFRYVWDGRVQAAGINPYLYVPAAPELAFLRDRAPGWDGVFAHINRAETAPTIYPPAGEALFALLGLSWSSVWGVKFAMLAFDVAAIGVALALLRAARQPAALVLIYAWNPLVLWEFSGGGHIDAAVVAFSGLALLAAVWRRPAWAGAALAVAVLLKLLPAALFPALWRRRDWRTPLATAAVIALGYACYAGAGWRVFGYLPGYAQEEGVGGHGAFLVRLLAEAGPVPAWADALYAALALAGLAALAAWIALRAELPPDPQARARTICRDALWLGAASLVALSPHYPWYFAGLALPAVLAPSWSVLWLTIAAPVLYLDDWHDKVIWPAIVFVPFAVLLVSELRRHGARTALAAKGG